MEKNRRTPTPKNHKTYHQRMPDNSSHHTAEMPTMKNPIAVLMYDSSVRSFANSVRCRASRSRIAVSNFSGMGDPQILTESIPLQRAKLNRPGEKDGRRRECARGRVDPTKTPDPFSFRHSLFHHHTTLRSPRSSGVSWIDLC